MPIDPNSVQWDQTPTPAPATQAGKSGGVIIIDSSKVNADAREAERLRLAQEAEARAAGKDARDVAEFEGTAGKPTEAQGKAATMLTRIEGNMGDIQDIVSKFPEQQTPGLKESLLYNSLGNASLVARNTTDWQRRAIRDAQVDIVDALLTLGTGAAYTPEQLAGQVTAYFPQYGDKPEEIAYKQRRLQRLILAAKAQAGPLAPKLEEALGPLMAGAAPEQGGGGEGPRITVTEEDSAKAWGGEPIYDEIGNPVGPDYEGMGYDKSGKEIGLVGRVTGEGKPEDSSLLGDIKETVTGDKRSTPEIEALPDWVTMPELNELSLKGFKVGAGTLLSGPEETARIIQAQFPDVRVRQDSKGNFILKSSDGQEYAIKPGFRWSDTPRALGSILAFTPAGRAETFLGAATGAAATQAAVEGSQAATGGTFDPGEVVAAGVAGPLGLGVQKVAEPVAGAIGKGIRKILPRAAEDAAPAALAGEIAPLSATEQTEVGAIAKEALGGGSKGKNARTRLAVMAQIDPEAKAAAERLGMNLPADILSDNAQIKTLSGLARSQIGGEADTAWRRTVSDTINQADKALSEIGATADLSQVSADVMERLTQNSKSLERAAVKERDAVTKAINVRDRVDATNLQGALAGVINDMGGIREAKQAFSPEERKLFAMLGEGEKANRPTYARLNQLRDQIGEALYKGRGPWADTSQANLAKYYGALADDQLAYVEAKGGTELADKMRASNTLFSKMYDARKTMQGVFGAQLEKDLGPLINRAMTGAQKGDAQALKKLLSTVPEDMRGQVVMSGLLANATRNSAAGGFSFDKFAKLYRGLRQNAPIYKQVAEAVGPQGAQVMNDLYAVSRRMAEGESRIVRTGASTQPLLNALNAENLVSKLMKGTARRIVVTGGSAATGGVLGGPMGAAAGGSVAEALQEAMAQGGKTRLDKLHTLLSSDSFRNLIDKVGTGDAEAAVNRLGGSKEWNGFASRVLGLKTPADRKAWLRAALDVGAAKMAEPRIEPLPVIEPVQ